MIFCKNYSLSKSLTIINFYTFIHQNIEHNSYCIIIKNPAVNSRWCYLFRHVSIIICKCIFILLFFIIRKVIIFKPVLRNFQSCFNCHITYKIFVFYRLCKVISICRNTFFKFKNIICILINFIFRCSCKPNKRCIKIIENIFVFVINRPMSLIAYY